MVRQVTATQAKAHLLAILDDVEAGDKVEITRRGKPIARIVPARGSHALRGCLSGVAMTNAPDEELFSTGVDWELA